MFTIDIVVNGKHVELVKRDRMVEWTSLLSTYRNCGWMVTKQSRTTATASRVV